MTESPPSALATVTAALAEAEDRPGQQRMAELVEKAIDDRRHLVVQAGTGTGKTLAYLVPAISSGTRVVVATATKALQDQLAGKDLPFLAAALPVDFDWAVLKGRSNYVCLQRLRELTAPGDTSRGQLELAEMSSRAEADLDRIAKWVATTPTGDVAELDFGPSDAVVRAVTVGSDECPGAKQCPMGEPCFAELARRRAQVADVVVVNTYLYGLHVASGGTILPEHDLVVFDEAHGLEDIMSTTLSVQIGPGRFVALGGVIRRILDDPEVIAGVVDVADLLRGALVPHVGERLPIPYPDDVQSVLLEGRSRLERALAALTAIETPIDDAKQKKLRAQLLTGSAITSVDTALAGPSAPAGSRVDFVSGGPSNPRLEIAPLDVGPLLREGVWEQRTAVLTSATIPVSLVQRAGFPPTTVDEADVGSPFDYPHNALLYCAMSLPDPRHAGYRDAVHNELAALISAAGGRTLALFTSWAAMDAASAALADRVEVPLLTQRDLPKPALLRAFAADEPTTLLATAGFFQGVDVPGRTLVQVVIDRLPFPRPDDPLLSARRELLGPAAFSQIDVPRAAMMLAQAAGRLIRTATDRGVVAVLDRRLGTARYRWDIVNALPPMRRTRERADVEKFLTEITVD
ncbi:MAG: putative ATP-dependent helicase [Desertimonas sp.]|nr:putative ATP-dependent helicase [Desertimonas sp.]